MTRVEAIAILDGFKYNPLLNDQHYEALDMAVSALSENKGEWIPVSERLPENTEYVLATDGLDLFVAWHNPEKERFKGWHSFDDHFDRQYPILAWQPLPEPYKAEKHETCKGCLEPCIMYEPNMRSCKHKVTEKGGE